LKVGVAGVGLLGLPLLVVAGASRYVSGVTTTAVFALVPVVVVMVAAQGGAEDGVPLAPALVGFAGLLFVLPVSLPEAAGGWVWLVGLVVVAGVAGVACLWISRLLQEVRIARAVMLVCGANAVILLVAAAALGQLRLGSGRVAGLFSVAAGVHGVLLVLLVVLLREMGAIKFSARYLVIPLLTVGEGFVLIRPEVTLRLVLGMLLMVGGTGWFLFGGGTGEDSTLSLR
jgi:drug/metabolite transporter (DMT)-like permease